MTRPEGVGGIERELDIRKVGKSQAKKEIKLQYWFLVYTIIYNQSQEDETISRKFKRDRDGEDRGGNQPGLSAGVVYAWRLHLAKHPTFIILVPRSPLPAEIILI